MGDARERWFYSYLPTNMAGGCFETLLPIFVLMVLDGDMGDIALISVVASTASVPAVIFWGRATDSVRWRKLFVVAGFFWRVIAYLFMGFALTPSTFLFGSVVMGLLASASTPSMTILIFESFAKEKWSEKIGLFNNIAGVGNLAGIAFGMAWVALAPQHLGFDLALRSLFFLNAGLALLGTVLAALLIREPDEKMERTLMHEQAVVLVRWGYDRARYLPEKMYRFFRFSHLGEISRMLDHKRSYIVWFLASTFLYNLGAVAFFTVMPVYLLREVGLSSTWVFALSLTQSLASTILYRKVGEYSDRHEKTTLLFVAKSARVALFASYALAFAISAWHPWAAIVFLLAIHLMLGLTWAFIGDTQMPIAVDGGEEGERGAIAGAFNAVVGLGSIAGGAAAGVFYILLGHTAMLLIATGIVFASALVLAFKVRR